MPIAGAAGCCARAASGHTAAAAERGQQVPPSDDDCHTPLPREVREIPRHERAVPNSAAPGEGGVHAGQRLQRSTAWPEDSGLISRDLSLAAPLHFGSEP